MRIKGIDCAAPLTAEKAQKFKELGYEFVGRYFCPDTKGNWKRLNKPEAEIISAAGLRLLCVWETTAARAGEGMAAGAVDGARAHNQALELGMPKNGTIYFAVDYDAQPAEFEAIAAYLKAASQQVGEYKIGVYGSYRVIEAMFERFGDSIDYWQCVAWSYGNTSSHLDVYQAYWNERIEEADHTVDINYCDDMDAAGLWNYERDSDMEYEKFKEYMMRYEAERAAKPEPNWSADEGAWAKAETKGIMDGTRPEDYVKRDELAAVLDRVGLLDNLPNREDEV